MILKRIGPLSFAKLSGFVYAVMGLIFGVLLAFVSFLGGGATGGAGGPVLGAIFGVGAVIILPILYGALGFLGSLLAAALYNWAAGLLGGIEIDMEDEKRGSHPEMGA